MPDVAIAYDQMGPFVRLVNDKNIVERRPVKLGVQEEKYRVVTGRSARRGMGGGHRPVAGHPRPAGDPGKEHRSTWS